ncbi:MAG: hypothetical protein IJ336_02905 [Lachnospiraceae bacterium]|nr:hypothetical protein [Lachnospiraceae bacterium]
MRYLFWNTHKNSDINDVLSELIVENDISIVCLAEYTAKVDELINKLSIQNVDMMEYGSCSERIKMFGKVKNIQYRTDTDHAIIRIINDKDILCCIHLNSKIYSGHEEIREIHMEQIIRDIQDIEKELQSENTIVVGDFNINPYESSLVNAKYFHGIPIYEEAKRKSRVIAGKEFYMFYNPMWNFLGDAQEPYGTYYYAGNDPINTYWNIYDQVIIRPALKARFVEDSLKIVKETKTRFLLDNNGHPNNKISDHLPIVFEIKEE